MVIKAGWANTMTALLELADTTVSGDVKSAVERAAVKALNGDPSQGLSGLPDADLVKLLQVQGTKSGQNYLMDLKLGVPKEWSVERTLSIEKAVRHNVGNKVRGVRRVKINFVPSEETSADLIDEFIGPDVSPRSSPEPEPEDGKGHGQQHKD